MIYFKSFFQDQLVLSTLKKLEKGTWSAIGSIAKKVNVEDVDCSLLSVDIFDRLFEKNIVRESGHIRGCFDEYFEDIQISDELRKLLLIEESDNYEIYSQIERNQFLFRLFKHLCLGGQVCQFEETLQPYIDVTKSIYKDLISVTKDPNTKAIKTVSFVFKVEAFVSKTLEIFLRKI